MVTARVRLDKRLISLSILIVSSVVFFDSIASPPASMYHNPVIIHDVTGVNPFPSPRKDAKIIFDVLPYYQHASSAKNADGVKVRAGDRLGPWSMLGLIQGTDASPSGALTTASQPTLKAAQDQLVTFGMTDETFTGSSILGHYSVPLDYEQYGLRAKLRFNIVHGLGAMIRLGFGCYRQEPEFLDLTDSLTSSRATKSVFTGGQRTLVKELLMDEGKRRAIAKEIGINLDKHTKTCFEDVHVQLHWSGSFRMDDEHKRHAVSVIPYLSIGVWLPTSCQKKEDIAFSLPTGNDGEWGLTLEGALNFEFPDTVQFGVGGAITFSGDDTKEYRMPTSLNQNNIYPWKVQARRDIGKTWYLHADLKAEDFIENLSFYFNYVYEKHARDTFTLLESATRNALFKVEKREKESSWHAQKVHFGFDYKAAKGLAFGFAVQAPITGVRVYKTTTLIATVRFSSF